MSRRPKKKVTSPKINEEENPPALGGGLPPSVIEKVEVGEPVEAKTEEVYVEPPKSNIVKVKVLIGTLQWEEGTFSKGDVFEATRERAERFSKSSVKIL